MTSIEGHPDQIAEAFSAGRRTGLAVSALALSFVAFLSLLGAEKAILAVVLGALAARKAEPGTLARRLGLAAIAIAVLFLMTLGLVLALYWDQLAELIRMIQQLS
jgi:hypothetical protein